MVERELAAVHAAAGFSAQQALKVSNSNLKLLADLGFGQSTLEADLQEDEDEDEHDLASFGAQQPAGQSTTLSWVAGHGLCGPPSA
jgi:hypothetical protein